MTTEIMIYTAKQSGSAYSTFIQRGLPLVLTTVVGWIGLSQFVKAKLDVQDGQRVYHEDEGDRSGISALPVEKQRAKAYDLEAELERIRAHHLDRREELVNKEVPR